MRFAFVIPFCALAADPAFAGKATVAVAANFLDTARRLETAFEASIDHEIALVHASTGLLYAQIRQGAPFDVYLAADQARPAQLVEDGLVDRIETYSFGRLVLVARSDIDIEDVVLGDLFASHRIAMADPAVAPYGQAAQAVLADHGAEDEDIVMAENVGHAASLFVTGNAGLALIAEAQVVTGLPVEVSVRGLDHPSIPQDAALLLRGRDNPAAAAFFDFLLSDAGQGIIAASGYGVPE